MIQELLELEMNSTFKRLNKKLILFTKKSYKKWLYSLKDMKKPQTKEEHIKALINFLNNSILQKIDKIKDLNSYLYRFKKEYSKASYQKEKEKIIIDYVKILGSKDLKGDIKALNRYFDNYALNDRFIRKIAQNEQKIIFFLDRLGVFISLLLSKDLEKEKYKELWKDIGFEKTILEILAYNGNKKVLVQCFKSIKTSLVNIPDFLNEPLTKEEILKYIYKSSLDYKQDIWVQCEALELLNLLSKESLKIVTKKRILEPKNGDDIFVRVTAIDLIIKNLEIFPNLNELLEKLHKDSSEYVRQKSIDLFIKSKKAIELLKRVLLEDKANEVRAYGVLKTVNLINSSNFSEIKNMLISLLKKENDEFVLKVVFQSIYKIYLKLEKEEYKDSWYKDFYTILDDIQANSLSLKTKRDAAKAIQKLNVFYKYKELYFELFKFCKNTTPLKKTKLPKDFNTLKTDEVAEILSSIAQEDFSYQLFPKKEAYFIIRGDILKSKSWRILYELFTPSSDKREAFNHTVGREYNSSIIIPSSIMSEVTKTKVPGEPFYISKEGDNRPFLPLLDHIQSNLSLFKKESFLYSYKGITKINSPKSIFTRVSAKMKLLVRFNDISKLRDLDNNLYIREIEKLGFKVELNSKQKEDKSIQNIFLTIFPIPFLDNQVLEKIHNYFFSVYENTIFELGIFVSVLALIFFTRNYFLSKSIKQSRENIPLVIGGWGSRGKSGTERLKASLFNALGYTTISKTTGCEAMFLYSHELGQTHEMFLFRPYDKATIWEQYDLLKLSDKLDADVFLWECMGLTPTYIDILQKKWMRDDISTITNTYPDHENLQGPAGINIPEVMLNFIAKDSTLITSEEQMTPILENGAKELNTDFQNVSWLEANLIPKDILKRFPYEEHPYNIALVIKLAKSIGLEEKFILKEMADNIIPDIGVLKIFPSARFEDKELIFINGMSANERFAALENWKRTGFEEKTIDILTSTLINNRADRVSRSKVFADIIAKDITADFHFLIGTNLNGFMGYVKEAFYDYAKKELNLFDKDNCKEKFIELCKRYKIPTSKEEIRYKKEEDYFNSFQDFLEKLNQKKDEKTLNIEFRDFIFENIKSRFIIMDNPHISGEEITEIILQNTPKNFTNKIIGMQNIKGPGLDFVYNYLEWERIYHSLNKLSNKKEKISIEGLKELSSYDRFPNISIYSIKEIISKVKDSRNAQSEFFQNEIDNILLTLSKKENTTKEEKSIKFVKSIFNSIENLLDIKDSIKRRKKADQIYKDLINERISYKTAINELKAINKRQKGGWFSSV